MGAIHCRRIFFRAGMFPSLESIGLDPLNTTQPQALKEEGKTDEDIYAELKTLYNTAVGTASGDAPPDGAAADAEKPTAAAEATPDGAADAAPPAGEATAAEPVAAPTEAAPAPAATETPTADAEAAATAE